ncbi:MAG: DUF5026 domain-containing protein [Clostridia bacterium]|nr:DUF5026 domain-containing protein [Clostridia bacterium]
MSILTTGSTAAVFDKDKVAKGDFIRAKYSGWDETVNGLVAKVTDTEIRVLYIGTIRNVTNYYTILADEVENGYWDISVSSDFSEVVTSDEDETEEETEGEEDDA